MRLDLHSHSTASDGHLSPEALVLRAVDQQVDVLALTDHDTVAGLDEAHAAIADHGLALTLIDGIEISCCWENHEIHVVGLAVDRQHPALLDLCQRQAESREWRARELDRKLAKLHIEGTYEAARALAGRGSLTRAHFARHLVAVGISKTMQKAFDVYLGRRGKAYVRPQWVSLAEACQVIHAAGGQAVLAHPTGYNLTAKWIKRLLADFVPAGGDAMEVSMAQQSPQERANLGQWSREFGLLASVGSDFHFPTPWLELGKQLWLPKEATPVWDRFLDADASNAFREES